MNQQQSGGAAWIAGSVLMLVTMSLHPTGHDLATPENFERGAFLARATHGLALLSLPLSFHGALALARRLGTAAGWFGLVVFGQALVAVMLAAIASGLIAPELFAARLSSAGATRDGFGLLLHYNGELNQACAKVYVLGSALALALWSLAILRTRAFAAALGFGGLFLALASTVALLSGHLRLDVHGFGALVLAQAAWMIAAGVGLWRRAGEGSSA
ncbi:MAG: hypothetical protein ABL998_20065 [Planctomycetota bacterium]